MAFDTIFTTGESDIVRITSMAFCTPDSIIMSYTRMANPAFCSINGFYIMCTIMAKAAGYCLFGGMGHRPCGDHSEV